VTPTPHTTAAATGTIRLNRTEPTRGVDHGTDRRSSRPPSGFFGGGHSGRGSEPWSTSPRWSIWPCEYSCERGNSLAAPPVVATRQVGGIRGRRGLRLRPVPRVDGRGTPRAGSALRSVAGQALGRRPHGRPGRAGPRRGDGNRGRECPAEETDRGGQPAPRDRPRRARAPRRSREAWRRARRPRRPGVGRATPGGDRVAGRGRGRPRHTPGGLRPDEGASPRS
jgi:hypothetical protein